MSASETCAAAATRERDTAGRTSTVSVGMPPPVVLVGGLSAFGGIGLLLGPLVVALFLSLLRIYERDFKLLHDAPSGG